jgi:cell division septum initiation protein DivIVA
MAPIQKFLRPSLVTGVMHTAQPISGSGQKKVRRCPIAILQVIDQLDALLEGSRRVPMSSLRMVDANVAKQVIERLRVNVPSSIIESDRMLQERDRILESAEAEAARLVEQAKRRAQEILSNDALVSASRQEAERIVVDSQRAAQQRRDEADRYAARVLEELAEKLSIISKQVDNGLDLLRQNLELGGGEPPKPERRP